MTTTTDPSPYPPEKTEPLERLLAWPLSLLPTNTLHTYTTIETLQACAHSTQVGVFGLKWGHFIPCCG